MNLPRSKRNKTFSKLILSCIEKNPANARFINLIFGATELPQHHLASTLTLSDYLLRCFMNEYNIKDYKIKVKIFLFY